MKTHVFQEIAIFKEYELNHYGSLFTIHDRNDSDSTRQGRLLAE